MKRINVLNKHIAELIAAGEVVERPSSVVKEIVENAIDAGSTKVQIEIEKGGTSLIRVSDNGHGIYREDIKNAFLRHATSKIKDECDLNTISTLGFRGEALASISAVSKVTVDTYCEGDEIGTRYEINGGEEKLLDDIGRARGTTITIRDLFFNTPARLKFLKSDVAEGNSVAGVLDRIALSHPEVAFKFIRDGKIVFNTPGNNDLSSCIYSVYGKVFFDAMMPVENEFKGIKINGFVSRPYAARNNRSMQHFFINGRYVKSKTACVALEEAFKGSIVKGKYPYCVIFIRMPFDLVDVNVHPAKIEVRFVDERPIFDVIYYGIKSSLMNNDRKKEINLDDIIMDKPSPVPPIVSSIKPVIETKSNDLKNMSQELGYSNVIVRDSLHKNIFNDDINIKSTKNNLFTRKMSSPPDIYHDDDDIKKDCDLSLKNDDKNSLILESQKLDEVSLVKNKESTKINITPSQKNNDNSKFISETSKLEKVDLAKDKESSEVNVLSPQKEDKSMQATQLSMIQSPTVSEIKNVVGEIFNCYIIVQKGKDEMVLIDKHAAHERILYEKIKSQEVDSYSQMLAESITVTLDKNEYSAVLENENILSELGYQVEDFGPGTIIVRSAPVYMEISDIQSSLQEIADYILKNKRNLNTSCREWLYHNIACRSAIKAGKSSSDKEILELVNKLEDNKDIMYCPHGRPVYVVLKKNDLEKQFNRT